MRSMDNGGYSHNYRDFYEKYISNVYKSENNDHNLRCPCKPCENSLLSSLGE